MMIDKIRNPDVKALVITAVYALIFFVLLPEFSVIPHPLNALLTSTVYLIPHLTVLALSYQGVSSVGIVLIVSVEMIFFFALIRMIIVRQMRPDED